MLEIVAASDPGETRTWRVPAAQTAVKGAGALVLAAIAALGAADRALLLLAGVAALSAAVMALRDVLAPVRLAAAPGGLTVVSGYAGRVHLPWPQVAVIKVDQTSRYGLRVRLLEIETSDQEVYLLSRHDLGEDPETVCRELQEIAAELS